MKITGKWLGVILFLAITGAAAIGNSPRDAFVASCFGLSFLISASFHREEAKP